MPCHLKLFLEFDAVLDDVLVQILYLVVLNVLPDCAAFKQLIRGRQELCVLTRHDQLLAVLQPLMIEALFDAISKILSLLQHHSDQIACKIRAVRKVPFDCWLLVNDLLHELGQVLREER